MSKTAVPSRLVIEYDLDSLPTAQHKAGLAGLLLMIKILSKRRMKPLPEVLGVSRGGAALAFAPDSLQVFFDDLFDAEWVEVESKSKWQNAKPKRTEKREVPSEGGGKPKTETRHVYDVVQPKAAFLAALYPPDSGIWLKLWRDMVWSVLRGIPKTREVYRERADGRPSSQAPKIWKELLAADKARKRSQLRAESIASSLFLGAQDVNAERVSFRGEASHNLLLHFWPVASLVYSPRIFDAKGERRDAGYALAIPEPNDLDAFAEDAESMLASLDTSPAGYRPKAAIIDLPEEGGLDYLYHLAQARVRQEDISCSLAAVETYRLQKQGNSVRMLAAERVLPAPDVLEQYEPLRRHCRNPFFKSRRIRNLLAGLPWHSGMDAEMERHPWPFFVEKAGKTPAKMPFFGADVRRKFLALEEAAPQTSKGGEAVSEDRKDEALAKQVYRLVRGYVEQETQAKSGKRYQDFKQNKDENGRVLYPAEYRDARERVCRDAFLAIRGRREQAFVEYFAGTVCSVPQFLPEGQYVAFGQALLADWQTVKTLALLALSACSFMGGGAETPAEKGEEE